MDEFLSQAEKAMQTEKLSMEKKAYLEIRRLIMQGICLPGTMLSENELAKLLNMSRTPIRAAIALLENEGFMQSIRGRGVIVKELSSQEFAQMYEVLVSMQLFVLDMAGRRGLSFDLETMKRHLDVQIKASEEGDIPTYYERNFSFIETLLQTLGNQNMLQLFDNMKGKFIFKMVAYRKKHGMTAPKPRQGRSANQGVYEALKRNDIEGAKAVIYSLYDYIYQNVYSFDI